MKKYLLISWLLALWPFMMSGQGSKVFVEGFDSEDFPSGWVQTDLTPDVPARWVTDLCGDNPFSKIESASTRSAKLNFSSRNTELILRSPEIDLAGLENLEAGFYGYELKYCLRGDVEFRFRIVSADGASSSDLLAALDNSALTGTDVQGWTLFKYSVPHEFEGKKVYLEFYVNASKAWGNPGGLSGYIDGVFVSRMPEVDASVDKINYSLSDVRPTSKAFTSSEPVTLTISNAGVTPLVQTEVYYRVNDMPEVVELFAPVQPLKQGESADYTFRKAADFGAPDGNFAITAGVRAPDDGNSLNDEITAYAQNIVAGVPYTPDFLEAYDLDGWTTDENSAAWWDYDDWNEFYWYIDHSYRDPTDAWIISRPVLLESGKRYAVDFSAMSEEDDDLLNRMAVYVGTSDDIEEAVEIWKNESIDMENCLFSTATYTAESTGPHYFFFKCYSEAGAPQLQLRDFSFSQRVGVDASVTAVTRPVDRQMTYSDSEQISVVVINKGSETIELGSLKVCYALDDSAIPVVETLPAELAPGAKADFVFATKADLSLLGHPYSLKVWTELENDEVPENDAMTVTLESVVAGVPYLPDMGTVSEKSDEQDFWTIDDANNDGYKFVLTGETSMNTNVYSYGGGMYGLVNVTLDNSDESLMSRMLRLEGGKGYKLSFISRLGKADASMPLAVNLVRVGDDNSTSLVKQIWAGNVTEPYYAEHNNMFSVEETGLYRIEYRVVNTDPIDFRIYLGNMRLTGEYGLDLSVEEIVVPTSHISSLTTFPVGVLVRNEGKATVSSFDVKASSPSIGEKSMTFSGIDLEPNGNYMIWFPEDFTFKGTPGETETLKVDIMAADDEYSGNDTRSLLLDYRAPEELPYSSMSHLSIDNWGTVNRNRDSFRFVQDRSMGVGYMYASDGAADAGDMLVSPGMSMEHGKVYSTTFSYFVNKGDVTDFNVSVLNAATGESVDIAMLRGVDQYVMSRFTGYFSVESDGVYSICFTPVGKASSLFISSGISVAETALRPDLELLAVKSPADDAVYGHEEKVVVEFRNAGRLPLQCVPFVLTVNDVEYSSLYTKYISVDDDVMQVEFQGVDLYAPGRYRLEAKALVGEEATVDNNNVSRTIVSLPVVDVAVCGITEPVSGVLGEEEKVVVTLRNMGKGDLTAVPVRLQVCRDGEPEVVVDGYADIPDGDEAVEYTFSQPVDFSHEGVYELRLTASPEGDINPEDNVFTAFVTSTSLRLDAGVTAISSPGDGILSESETVTVTIRNYGEADIFGVPVSAVVYYDGESVGELQGTVPSVAMGQDVSYTLPGVVDMKRQGDYRIVATVSLPKDADGSNDSAEAEVRCLTQDVGVVAIVSPESGADLGQSDVTVLVMNYGEAPVGNIPMQYQIGSMPQLDTLTEVIAPGETVSFTFGTKYEFTAHKSYKMTARTLLPDDHDPANDSCETVIINSASGVESIGADQIDGPCVRIDGTIVQTPADGDIVIFNGKKYRVVIR